MIELSKTKKKIARSSTARVIQNSIKGNWKTRLIDWFMG